jgi:hypothetical protein
VADRRRSAQGIPLGRNPGNPPSPPRSTNFLPLAFLRPPHTGFLAPLREAGTDPFTVNGPKLTAQTTTVPTRRCSARHRQTPASRSEIVVDAAREKIPSLSQ